MSRNNAALKAYWNGYRAAKADVYECGFGYAENQYAYGLNGCSGSFCNGYRAYLKKVRDGKITL